MKKTKKTQYAILGLLSIAPMSGYEIKRYMRKSTDNFWRESDGQLYPTLSQLKNEQCIAYKTPVSSGSRDKKIYCITKKGEVELKKWLMKEPETQIVRNEFMLKVFLGANVEPQITLEQVHKHLQEAKLKLANLSEKKKKLNKEYKNSSHLSYWLFTIDYGIQLLEGKITWCGNVIRTLEKRK